MSRLFEIIYILMKKDTVTAKELAEKFEVSVRTIYRDIDKLTLAGIPIYCMRGKNGGIFLTNNFILNKSILSEEEQNYIIMGLESISVTEQLNVSATLSKLCSFFQKKNSNWIKVEFSTWGGNYNNTFEYIRNSILQNKVIMFEYYNSNGKFSKRKVEPIQLMFKSITWYLIAFCLEKKEQRIFKLSRIDKLKVTDNDFIPKDVDLNLTNYKTKEKMINLKLLIDKSMGYRVYDEFKADYIKKDCNQNYIITISLPENEWTYQYILSFGKFVKVIEPLSIKTRIKECLEESLKFYL